MHKISTVFFDLGSTLVYAKYPWEPIYARADSALVSSLHDSGIFVNNEAFISEYGGFIMTYYACQGNDYLEKTAQVALQEVLESQGYFDIPGEALRAALDNMYAITQQNWYIEEDALPTLELLKKRGLHLGLISNTSDDKNVQQLVDRWNIRPYMDFIITSAAFGIRKPDDRIFQLALDFFQVEPHESIMVGDSLEADITGANLKGIYSVWITRRVDLLTRGNQSTQPWASVTSLAQVPGLL